MAWIPLRVAFLVGIALPVQSSPGPSSPAPTAVGIHAVQGRGGASAFEGRVVCLTGIVTGSFQGGAQLHGFHLQTPDAQADHDPLTSEGIFVRTGKGDSQVAVGDSVQVEGTVSERGGLTQIIGSSVAVLASGRPLPKPVELRLPFQTLQAPERWESMRVALPQELVVTGNYGLARFGAFVVAPRRVMTPTQVVRPGAAARAALRKDSLSWLAVDDGSVRQDPSHVPYPTGGLSAANPLRTGTKVSDLAGLLDFRYGMWTLQPTCAPVFLAGKGRAERPEARRGTVRVASFNVHNYFTTRGSARACGPSRHQACRGVDDTGEFLRQKAKILAALKALEADVVGLMEVENHAADSALIDLVNGLNDSMGAGTWARVATGPLGMDVIKVALIYRPDRVSLVGAHASLTRARDPVFVERLNRVPLAQTFQPSGAGGVFTVAVSHLKSKGSACAGDPDLGDGQGHCNATRTRAAESLARWIKARPTGTASDHALLIGDFNAYAKEDPMTRLAQSGLVNLVSRDQGDSSYSYQFGNAFGTLDHALATPALAKRARASHWAINADEPKAPDFRASPFGSSDHDPIVVDLDLTAP